MNPHPIFQYLTEEHAEDFLFSHDDSHTIRSFSYGGNDVTITVLDFIGPDTIEVEINLFVPGLSTPTYTALGTCPYRLFLTGSNLALLTYLKDYSFDRTM